MSGFFPEKVFEELSGKSYDNYNKFMEDLVREFNKHILSFPPGYTSRDLLQWGEHNNWIVKRKNGKEKEIVIEYNKHEVDAHKVEAR